MSSRLHNIKIISIIIENNINIFLFKIPQIPLQLLIFFLGRTVYLFTIAPVCSHFLLRLWSCIVDSLENVAVQIPDGVLGLVVWMLCSWVSDLVIVIVELCSLGLLFLEFVLVILRLVVVIETFCLFEGLSLIA